jgi:1-phosphofructokinase family hexose kinase
MKMNRIPKIAMLTVNPGIDRTMYFDKPLLKGEVNRATSTNLNQGCKGANAVIVMARHGADVTYYTYTGGPFGSLYESFLEAENIPTVAIPMEAGVRLNVKLSDGAGVFTECNQGGGPVSEAEKNAMLDALRAGDYECLCLAGSLPKGLPLDFYGECVKLAHEKGAMVVADCDGAVLIETLKFSPDIIKPNKSEFAALIPEGESITEKIAIFKQRYPGTKLLLSLGKEGAIWAGEDTLWHAPILDAPVRGTVAAGDTFLSSFVVSILAGNGVKNALAVATAASTAKVQLPGTQLPTAEQMADRVELVAVAEFKE